MGKGRLFQAGYLKSLYFAGRKTEVIRYLHTPLHIVGTPEMLTGSSNAGRASVVSKYLLVGSFELRNSSKPLLEKKYLSKELALVKK